MAEAPYAGTPLDRVCVVMLAAVGDAVHVLPVLNAIRRHHPASRISWVLQPGLVPFVAGHPAVDETIPFERARGWRGFADVRRRLRTREFDAVLLMQPYLKAGLVASFARAPYKLGFDRGQHDDADAVERHARDGAGRVSHRRAPAGRCGRAARSACASARRARARRPR